MKPSNSFINDKKINKSLQQNENLPKNSKIKTLTRQIPSNLLQLNTLNNKTFLVNQKYSNNLSKKIPYKNISGNKNSKKNTKKLLDINHRPSISTDFSLSLEFGSLMNINKIMEDSNNTKYSKNKLIKVNTKRNNYEKNLSLRNQSKTNKKYDINKLKNFENTELFKNISEINIFNNETLINKSLDKNIEHNVINKIIYLQQWWKNIINNKYNSILILITSIKKIFLLKPYILIKNTFPIISYFLYKWKNITNKQTILKLLIKYKTNVKQIRNNIKSKNNKIKISPRNSINGRSQESFKNTKKTIKNTKLINSNKKIISINTNKNSISPNTNNNNCSKKININFNNSNYCQTTKHNINNKINYINFNININNNKKAIPYSPKSKPITERYTSPINKFSKKSKTKKKSLSKKTKKIKDKDKEKEKKNTNKIQNNKLGKIKNKKISPKSKTSIGENIIKQKNNSKLNNIISQNNSNSKNDTHSLYEESNSGIYINPNSQFNNYILNLNQKQIDLNSYYHNYSKGEKNENKLKDENINIVINSKNSKSQYYKTNTNSNKINCFFKNQISKSNSKVYENRLYKNNKLPNFDTYDKGELININMNMNMNKMIEKDKNKKNSHKIPINKHVILHKKEKGKLSMNKEFSNHKKNINYDISINNSYQLIKEENSNISKLNSIDINSNKNLLKQIYFHFWKEFVDKKFILQKLINFSKFLYHINHYRKIISLKNSIQQLIEIQNKEKLYQYFISLIFKIIINIFKKIFIYKNNNDMREIKIFRKNDLNHILKDFGRGKGDIINNININNYIHYDDCIIKRKEQNSNLLSKIIDIKTNNNNSKYDYYSGKKRYTITNSNSEKYIDFSRQTISNNISNINTNRTKNEEIIAVKIYNDNIENENENDNKNIIQINNEILKKNNSGYLNNILAKNNQESGEGVIIDQINQLKMVFNLLERHTTKNNNKTIYTLFDCFNKWKLYSSINNIKSLKQKNIVPKISEKIINLKPFQNSKIINNSMQNNPNDLPLKKNFSLSKMSPKIINVINVQNFNENNNYNYNFKYLPIKDIPIYPLKQRHSYAYTNLDSINNLNNVNNMNNTNSLNNDINHIDKNDINENDINENSINNNLNATSFIMLNDNKHINSNIIYHKKKLGSTYINNNYNFNFANNIDNLVNNSSYNNCYYKLEQKTNYDNSSFLFLDQNQSQIILPAFSNRIYNIEKNNKNLSPIPGIFRENSFKEIRSCVSKDNLPEQKFGFKKLNQIEEKEINFENNNFHKNKKLYIKKQHLDTKKTKISINKQNNIKTSTFTDIDNTNENEKEIENVNNKNLIKSLNIQFGRSKKYKKNDKDNNCITISEDIYDNKDNINVKIGQVSLKKKNFKQIFCKNIINENEEHSLCKEKKRKNYKLNKIFSLKYFINLFQIDEKINNKRKNISYDADSFIEINKDFKKIEIKNNYTTI